MDNLLFNSDYIKQKLDESTYNSSLGIRLIKIATMDVSGKEVTLIAVKLDPGKQLIPHLHEIDGEICIPLSEGLMTLGKAIRDEKGDYKVDHEAKIMVEWEESQKIYPGKPIEIAPGIAHHLLAPKDQPIIVFFLLPATHLEGDKKFVTYPEIDAY